MKHLADELRRTATTDSLTGVANRRQFDELIEREWKRARRAGDPLSLMLVDVDHFKLYNDRYGHPMGDTCLQNVAKALAGSVRRTADFVARCGGEEFGVVLPQTGRRGAEYMAQHLLDSVATLGIPHAASATAPIVTVSIGVACYDDESPSYSKSVADVRFRDDSHVRCTENELVLAADTALYSAKRAGRARARLLDIADVNAPHRVRDIEPNSVSQCAGAWA